MSLVALPLAHPLTAEQVEQLGGADVRMYAAGETIVVTPATAMMIIRAGWAQVDPNNQKAVAAALAVTPPDASIGTTTTPPLAAAPATVSSAAAAFTSLPQARPPGGDADGSRT